MSLACDPGTAHLTFRANDCMRLYGCLVPRGVQFVNPPVAIEAGINKGGYGCDLRDPHGFILTVLQPPTSVKTVQR